MDQLPHGRTSFFWLSRGPAFGGPRPKQNQSFLDPFWILFGSFLDQLPHAVIAFSGSPDAGMLEKGSNSDAFWMLFGSTSAWVDAFFYAAVLIGFLCHKSS